MVCALRIKDIIFSYKKGQLNLRDASCLLSGATGLSANITIDLLSKFTRQNIISLPVRGKPNASSL